MRALVISPQVAGEHQLNAQGKLKIDGADAQKATRQLMAFCERGTEPDDVLRALEIESRWNIAWWDAMHLAYAIGAGCTHFLTEDAQSAPTIEGIRIVDPFHVAPEDLFGAA
jgi:predicted nucleic acid-binding protein